MMPVPGSSSTVPSFYVQALTDSGTVGITATAPGYSQGNTSVTLHPSGFVSSTGDFTWFTVSPEQPAPDHGDGDAVRIGTTAPRWRARRAARVPGR